MTISVTTQDIVPALKKAAKVAAKSGTLPILEHIALLSDNGQLHITANDLQRCTTSRIPCDGDIQACCVRARTLAAALQTARTEDITLTAEGGELTVRAGRNRQTIKTLPYNEFPQPEIGDHTELHTKPADLARAISAVRYAAATKDVRPYLNGIYIGEGYAVASDGHRLARVQLNSGEHRPVIIPAEAASDIIDRAGGPGCLSDKKPARYTHTHRHLQHPAGG